MAFAIGAGLFVDGIDIYLTSGIAGALVKQGFATLKDVGHLAIATALGLALGGLASGILAEEPVKNHTEMGADILKAQIEGFFIKPGEATERIHAIPQDQRAMFGMEQLGDVNLLPRHIDGASSVDHR